MQIQYKQHYYKTQPKKFKQTPTTETPNYQPNTIKAQAKH